MDPPIMKGEWRSAIINSGVQCVTISGAHKMLM